MIACVGIAPESPLLRGNLEENWIAIFRDPIICEAEDELKLDVDEYDSKSKDAKLVRIRLSWSGGVYFTCHMNSLHLLDRPVLVWKKFEFELVQ